MLHVFYFNDERYIGIKLSSISKGKRTNREKCHRMGRYAFISYLYIDVAKRKK
jgi:hypothetical protein